MTALLALTAIVAVVFLALGAGKVAAVAPMRVRAAHLGYSTGAYRVIGTLEIAGAVGVALGPVAPSLGALAAVGLLLLLCGAAVTHVRHGDRPSVLAPALVAALLVAAYLAVLLGARP
ncbi:DoxX family protein [Pseudonocardia sp. NPDC049154]|uniref:DoxX family protein n=1 Tax=Pseudonocardia sp. NPDC049154 TaxID=3155501 RepID=UPI0033FDFEA8